MRKDAKDGGSAVVASGVHQEGLGAHCEDRDGGPGVFSSYLNFTSFFQVPALTVFVIELLEGNRTLYKPCGRHLGSQEG